MSDHSLLSPSSAKRWINCAGSINLIKTLPASAFKTSKYAAEGTVAHGLAEAFALGKVDLLTLTSRVGEVVEEDGFDITIGDDMVEGAIEYADFIADLRKRLLKPAPVVSKSETKIVASSVDPEVYGRADWIIYQKGNELHVVDYKFGKGVVEADDNEQGGIYVIGAEDSEAGEVFDKAFFHIVQPRARHNDGTVRTWEIPKGRLAQFRVELKAAVARTRDPNATRHAGAWCKFCPAMAYCDEVKKGIEASVRTVFTELPAPPSKEIGLTFLPPVGQLTVAQLGAALDFEDVVDSWFEAVRARMLAELSADPNSVPGYKLVEGKTNRAWRDDAEAEAAFALLGDDRYAPRKLKSPAQLEKQAGKDEVAKYVFKPQGKPTVAKSTDKRASIASPTQTAKDVFDVVGAPAEEENIFGDLVGAVTPKLNRMWP